ncbi:hypothetical protein DYI26_19305 [Halomonas litopenaei]|nr:hypothetical protein [Halomonas litopenaei]
MNQRHIDAFESLVKRQATPAEAARLEKVRETLGVSQDDAIWLIFIGLEYYLALYGAQSKTIEDRIEKSIKLAVQEISIPVPEPHKPRLSSIAVYGVIFGSMAAISFAIAEKALSMV